MSLGRAPRVAVAGVRRVRTGLGLFLAKHLVANGAVVPAFLASRAETIDNGRASLAAIGIEARGFVDLDALLAAEPVDALVIASPHETHLAWIDAAFARGLHVLCEKPLVWDVGSPKNEAMRLVKSARDRGLVFFENCPWPYALPAFDALHPGARRGGVRTFEMELAPSSDGPRDMVVDALSHPLSVVQSFLPYGAAKVRALTWRTAATGHVDLSFLFGLEETTDPIRCEVRLRTVREQPRPMALVVNGQRADRGIRLHDYALSFASGHVEIPLPDPMAALVGDFVRAVRDGEPDEAAGRRMWAMADRARLLAAIVSHFPAP